MAIYHLSVQIIGRQAGRSAVAASAYRSAEKLTNQYDGLTHDYTKKQWVTHTELLLPDHAPPEFKNRQTLWNSVEAVEKSSVAQLAREITIAIPRELPPEAQVSLVKKFVQDTFVSEGMCADILWHDPPVMDDLHRPIDAKGRPTSDPNKMQFINPHAHILLTMRPIDSHGRWQKKSVIQYICKRGSEEKTFTADTFKIARKNGWQKQYRYYNDRHKKIWLTPSEAEALGYTRVSRTPKTTPMGLPNPIIKQWNSKDSIKFWREAWAVYANRALDHYGFDDRIDHRSYADQGRDLEVPTIHMGPAATNLEKRAARLRREDPEDHKISASDIGDINCLIQEHNQVVRDLLTKEAEELAAFQKKKESLEAQKHHLSSLRSQLIGLEYQRLELSDKLSTLSAYITLENERISRYSQENIKITAGINATEQRLADLNQELSDLGISEKAKKEDLQKEIQAEEARLHNLREHASNLLTKYQFTAADDVMAANTALLHRQQEESQLQQAVATVSDIISDLASQYKQLFNDMTDDYQEEFIEELIEETIAPELVNTRLYGSAFDNTLFSAAVESVNQLLQISRNTYRIIKSRVKKAHR